MKKYKDLDPEDQTIVLMAIAITAWVVLLLIFIIKSIKL